MRGGKRGLLRKAGTIDGQVSKFSGGSGRGWRKRVERSVQRRWIWSEGHQRGRRRGAKACCCHHIHGFLLSRLMHPIFAVMLSTQPSEATEEIRPLLLFLTVSSSQCFPQSGTCVLPPSLLFPGSSLVGYNAGSQPALQTDGPLIRCASALPLLPAARFLIKLKPKEEREREIDRERNRAREKQRVGEEGGGVGLYPCLFWSLIFV